MCIDPVSLAAIGTAVSASTAAAGTAAATAGTALGGLGTIFSIGSGLVGAYATFANSRAQAAALKQQAADEEIAARERIQQGDEESDRRRRAGAIQLGQQRAAMAANGIDVEGDLSLDIMEDSSSLITEDAFSIRENARKGAQAFSQRAANSKTQAANVKSQGTFGAISTILTTGAKVGSKFRQFSSPVGAYS